MTEIEYEIGESERLDSIESLWVKLNIHHAEVSPHFSDQFRLNRFEKRKLDLVQKSARGKLRVEIAKAKADSRIVGYCIGTVCSDRVGEIDSIYVDSPFRGQGIAEQLMSNIMCWLDSHDVIQKIVTVATGNESILPLYQKYGFFPRISTLVYKD